MVRGRLSDGKTARITPVEVTLEDEGLRLTPLAQGDLFAEPELWPYAVVRLVDHGGGELRLGRTDAPDMRLVVPDALRGDLAARAPKVLTRAKASARVWGLVTAAVAGSLVAAAAIFMGIPLAAGPLAQATPPGWEEPLGDFAADTLRDTFPRCEGPNADAAEGAIAPLAQALAKAGGVEQPLDIAFVAHDTPNALALPAGRIKITSGLLEALDAPDQLAAVLAHEIGHVRARDGLIGLYRRAGMALALELVTGGAGLGQALFRAFGDLADLGHTRVQEERADDAGRDMMAKAGYDPAALARAFNRMRAWAEADAKTREGPDFELPEWLSTHPDLEGRIARAGQAPRPDAPAPLSAADWAMVRAACGFPDLTEQAP